MSKENKICAQHLVGKYQLSQTKSKTIEEYKYVNIKMDRKAIL